MGTAAFDVGLYPMKEMSQDHVYGRAHIVLTTAGAVDTTLSKYPHPSIVVTKNGGTTGQYDITYPFCVRGTIDAASIFSPLSTIGQGFLTARNFGLGTASMLFSTPAGTAAYGASADEFDILFILTTK